MTASFKPVQENRDQRRTVIPAPLRQDGIFNGWGVKF